MPGVPLSPYPVPTISQSLTTILGNTIICLQTLKTDIEATISAAEIDVNGDLDFNGWKIISVGAVSFESVADANDFAPGTIVFSNDEWYLVTGDDAIQVTLNGALNVAASGAIVGAGYGSNGKLVTYNDTNDSYEFTADGGIWADIECDDLVLKGSLGSTRHACHNSLATATTLNWNITVPGAGTSPMIVDNSGNITRDGWSNAITVSGTITMNGGADIICNNGSVVQVKGDTNYSTTISGAAYAEVWVQGPTSDSVRLRETRLDLFGTSDFHHEVDYTYTLLPNPGMSESIASPVVSHASGVTITSGKKILVPFQLPQGERAMSIKVAASGSGSPTLVITAWVVKNDGSATSLGTVSNVAIGAAWAAYTLDITDTTLVASGQDTLRILIESNVATTVVGPVSVIADRP